jgi:TolB-like protein/DNA-binding winged helix-turn-helix (wHTH) protein/Tfp pilus assembly protein PilF
MDSSNLCQFQFGSFLLDPVEKVLWRDEHPVRLPPKAIETLLVLIEKHGHVVDKAELFQRVWPNTFVEESTLAQNIFTLRKKLGDAPNKQGHAYIETVPKRGYRFVAPVYRMEPGPATKTPGSSSLMKEEARRRIWAPSIAAGLLLGLGVWLGWGRFQRHERPLSQKVMLAVVPFENLSGDPGQDSLCAGLTEELITELGSLNPGRIVVITDNSPVRYTQTSKGTGHIGSDLGVDYLVEGSVVRASHQVRINSQLIRVRDQWHVWARSYERDLGGILTLQDNIASEIASAIEFKLGNPALPNAQSHGSENPRAYEEYLKGRYFWNKRSEQGYLKAVRHFNQAIAEDPGYARAYSGLADAYALLGSNPTAFISRREAMEKARDAARKALALDGGLVEAHTSLAFIYWHYDWNWPAAEREFQRALQLNPSYPTAHHWYAYYLMSQGKTELSLAEIRRAQELDPLSLIIATDAAELLCYAGRYDQAIEQAQKVLDMDPNFAPARLALGWSYAQKRDYNAAVRQLKTGSRVPGARSVLEGNLAATEALAGQRAEARKLLTRFEAESERDQSWGPWMSIAAAHGALGDRDGAFFWLERDLRARDGGLTMIRVLPFFGALRSDPRFENLVRRIGLPQT